MEYNKEDVIAKECRFAVLCPPDQFGDDLHSIKEITHLKDGRTIVGLRLVKNFERPFYVTKKHKQNHKEKKQYEHIDNLDRYKSTQSKLINKMKSVLGIRSNRVNTVKDICNSPYIYGGDEPSTTIIKKAYEKKYPKKVTPWSMATLDTETDVVHGTGDIILCTVTMGSKAYTAIVRDFFFENRMNKSEDVARKEILKKADEYIKETMDGRKINWEIEFVDYDYQAVINSVNRLHQWKPDFVAIWNMNFDFGKMVGLPEKEGRPRVIGALEKAGIDPAQVFSDPSIPDEFKFFQYIEGPSKKKKDNGDVVSIKPSAQWHTVKCPSTFYFIDAMCAYRQVRQGGHEEKSYSLASILAKVFKDKPNIRKLNFKEADGLSGLEWHEFMQSKYKSEYCVYNLFDCVGMEILDEKTIDLRTQLPFLAGTTDLEKFPSQPTRLRDFYSTKLLDEGYVITTMGETMEHELDKLVTDLGNWIVALNPYLLIAEPMQVTLEEGLVTSIYGHSADIDVTGSYPWGQIALGVEKSTCVFELHAFDGIEDADRRIFGINMSGGHTNAIEICVGLLKLPTPTEALDMFKEELYG